VQAPGKLRPDPRNDPEDVVRFAGPAQAFEIAPAARAQHLDQRRSDPPADSRDLLERFHAASRDDLADIPVERLNRVRGPPIGGDTERVVVLLRQQHRRFAQTLGGHMIEPQSRRDRTGSPLARVGTRC
jgi:hypothetical protein